LFKVRFGRPFTLPSWHIPTHKVCHCHRGKHQHQDSSCEDQCLVWMLRSHRE
jgi:hypothetical protein